MRPRPLTQGKKRRKPGNNGVSSWSTLPLLLLVCSANLPGIHGFYDGRELENIFAHSAINIDPVSLPEESRQSLEPVRNRVEVNRTSTSEADGSKLPDGQNNTQYSDIAITENGNEPATAETETPSVETMREDLLPSTPSPETDESTETPGTTNTTQTTSPTISPSQTFAPSSNASSQVSTRNETVPTPTSTAAPTTPTTLRRTIVVLINSSFVVTTQEATWTQPSEALEGAPKEAVHGLTAAFSKMAALVVEKVNDRVKNITNQDGDMDNDNEIGTDTDTEEVNTEMEGNNTQTNNGTTTAQDSNNTQQDIAIARLRSKSRPSGRYFMRQLQVSMLNATVEYVATTAVIIGLRPTSECSAATSDRVCLTTFGQYTLVVDASEDSQGVYDTFVRESQAAIAEGLLQQQLVEVDPDNIFSVEGASEPVIMPPLLETIPDEGTEAVETDGGNNQQENDNTDTETNDNGLDSVMLGLIIAISVTACVVCVLLAVFIYLKLSAPPQIREKSASENDPNGIDPENPNTASAIESNPPDKEESVDDSDSNSESSSHLDESSSLLPEEAQKREYRRRVGELVQEHCPEESEHIDQMLMQFRGRELALIAMLENMDAVERELEKEQGHKLNGYSDDDWSDENDGDELPTAVYSDGEEAKEEVQEVGLKSEDEIKSIS